MSNSAKIDTNNIVENVAVGMVTGYIPCDDDVGIGYIYTPTTDTFAPPVIPPPEPTKSLINIEMRRRIALVADSEEIGGDLIIRDFLIMKKQIFIVDPTKPDLTTSEATEYGEQYVALKGSIVPIVQAAKVLLRQDPLDPNYKDNSNWPPIP